MSEETKTLKDRFFFGLNGFPDQMTYQFFTAYVFAFYFAVVNIDTVLMWIGYTVWGIWNAINDPLIGHFSDKKKYGRYGKRRFLIMVSFIPLCLMMVFLFTSPLDPMNLGFIYFLSIIMLFELIYTFFDVNVKGLFPEMWPNEKERAQTNIILRVLTILGILIAFILPAFILPDYATASANRAAARTIYLIVGGIIGGIAFITALLFILFGIKEPEERPEEFEKRPGFIESLKITLKNKNFLMLVLANMMTWYVLTMLTTMYSFYVEYVLGVSTLTPAFGIFGTFMYYGISIVLAFLVAVLTMPLHKKIGIKYGMRNGFIINMAVMGTVFLFFFLLGSDIISQIFAFLVAAGIGFGISGIMFYFDILMGDIIDQDAIEGGVKRSASFYGANAFIHRFSIIFFITSVFFTFQYTAWEKGFTPVAGLEEVIGLKLLLSLFPAIACFLALLFMKFYKLHGEKLKEMREKL